MDKGNYGITQGVDPRDPNGLETKGTPKFLKGERN